MIHGFKRADVYKSSASLKSSARILALCGVFGSTLLFSGCGGGDGSSNETSSSAVAQGISCNEGDIKNALASYTDTTVVQVKSLPKGFRFTAEDWHVGSLDSSTAGLVDGNGFVQVKLAADMCLVKLLVGPGYTTGVTESDPQYSKGIGIEVWLPAKENWNQRIRNYGGGGLVGGAHRQKIPDDYPATTTQSANIGSKFPAPIIAGMGYVVATTDAGQSLYGNGSFSMLKDGKTINTVLMQDFSWRAMVEQANKTKLLVKAFYGKAQQYAYFDGQSQGGRQVMKIAQEYPDLYDGYLAAAPAIKQEYYMMAGGLYSQLVMKADLGYTALAADGVSIDTRATALRNKMRASTIRAVNFCDNQNGSLGFGYLLDPDKCSYNPATDAAALCAGQTNTGVVPNVVGTGTDAYCLTVAEAQAFNKIWYGPTSDGSFDASQTTASRGGQSLGTNQLWWGRGRGTNISGYITNPQGTDYLAWALQDIRYSAGTPFSIWGTNAPVSPNFINGTITQRNLWTQLDYLGLVDVFYKLSNFQSVLGDLFTSRTDLSKARDLKRKVIIYNGMADEAVQHAGVVNYYEKVAAGMGGISEAQKFARLYLVPGMRHSSQGWAYTVKTSLDSATLTDGGNGFARNVPLPKMPGAENQTPTEDQDQMFSALKKWVEAGTEPGDMLVSAKDNSLSYPICVYPKKTVYKGGSKTASSSYACE